MAGRGTLGDMNAGDPRHHSADRRWWWDGEVWQPAVSIDGRYWFDGYRWVTRTRQPFLREARGWLARTVPLGVMFVVLSGVVASRVPSAAFSAAPEPDTLGLALRMLGWLTAVALVVGGAQGWRSPFRGGLVAAATAASAAFVCFLIVASSVGSASCGSAPECDIAGVPAGVEVGSSTFVAWEIAMLLGWLVSWWLSRSSSVADGAGTSMAAVTESGCSPGS